MIYLIKQVLVVQVEVLVAFISDEMLYLYKEVIFSLLNNQNNK